jgi:hypothetical protein
MAIASTVAIVQALITVAVTLTVGMVHVPLREAIRAVTGGGNHFDRLIVHTFREPRVLTALVVGACHASSNPTNSPSPSSPGRSAPLLSPPADALGHVLRALTAVAPRTAGSVNLRTVGRGRVERKLRPARCPPGAQRPGARRVRDVAAGAATCRPGRDAAPRWLDHPLAGPIRRAAQPAHVDTAQVRLLVSRTRPSSRPGESRVCTGESCGLPAPSRRRSTGVGRPCAP